MALATYRFVLISPETQLPCKCEAAGAYRLLPSLGWQLVAAALYMIRYIRVAEMHLS